MPLLPLPLLRFVLLFSITGIGCTAVKKNTGTMNGNSSPQPPQEIYSLLPGKSGSRLLDSLMALYPAYFTDVIANAERKKVQLIYTQIDRDEAGNPHFTHHNFGLNAAHYFYPASTVKFPVAALALQRLNELNLPGIDRNTTLVHDSLQGITEGCFTDSTQESGKPSVAGYIKKIMLVSDNDAFNRLYEWLGPDYINRQLHARGYAGTQITHRLSIALSEEKNRKTNAVRFLDTRGQSLLSQPEQFSKDPHPSRNNFIGKAYYQGDNLIEKPMDFSKKNRLPLEELHRQLMSIVFPEVFPTEQRFTISANDRRFLLRCMSQWPTESRYPDYSADTNYYPAYCKFLLYGAGKGLPDPGIRIFNKVGDAYGQLTDAAYIVDFKRGVEFFLSATIYCNADEVLNDDKYDYDSVGFPFMKHLGEVILDFERKRVREFPARLEGLRMDYSE